MDKIKDITKLYPEFIKYHEKFGAWGSLHIVLEDSNLETRSVEYCKKHAIEKNDLEGIKLAEYLLNMSKSQRGKISNKC